MQENVLFKRNASVHLSAFVGLDEKPCLLRFFPDRSPVEYDLTETAVVLAMKVKGLTAFR